MDHFSIEKQITFLGKTGSLFYRKHDHFSIENRITFLGKLDHFSIETQGRYKAMSKARFEAFCDLTKYHIEHCDEYRRMLQNTSFDISDISNIKSPCDLPFLPVSLFKDLRLQSISDDQVFKIMTSSGTSAQKPSRIYLSRENALSQQRALVDIMGEVLGAARLPMLIIDNPSVIKDRAQFSARGAGILGFSLFGTDRTYAFDDDMHVNAAAIEQFLGRHQGERLLLFGFTFMTWLFLQEIVSRDLSLDFSQAVLIHGGGWKKLLTAAVSPREFKQRFYDMTGITCVRNYYGMVEQTGSIYLECEAGHLHTNTYNDIIVRRARDFSPCDYGERGIVQVLSILPTSYPGHSLLTEDEGMIFGEDDCPCGKQGRYFAINGRLPHAEIRGCSDTYAK